ncbi:MAG: hypothetical protein H6707_02515 [Deltaproteobacteria bacterium]|nr:hypothetical protein [Deltaproteobacteria bacterium]
MMKLCHLSAALLSLVATGCSSTERVVDGGGLLDQRTAAEGGQVRIDSALRDGAVADQRTADARTVADLARVDGALGDIGIAVPACLTNFTALAVGDTCNNQVPLAGGVDCTGKGTVIQSAPQLNRQGWSVGCSTQSAGDRSELVCVDGQGALTWRSALGMADCPPALEVISGGCDCGVHDLIASKPTARGWSCRCHTGQGTAHVLCIDTACASRIKLTREQQSFKTSGQTLNCKTGRLLSGGCEATWPADSLRAIEHKSSGQYCQTTFGAQVDVYAICGQLP